MAAMEPWQWEIYNEYMAKFNEVSWTPSGKKSSTMAHEFHLAILDWKELSNEHEFRQLCQMKFEYFFNDTNPKENKPMSESTQNEPKKMTTYAMAERIQRYAKRLKLEVQVGSLGLKHYIFMEGFLDSPIAIFNNETECHDYLLFAVNILELSF